MKMRKGLLAIVLLLACGRAEERAAVTIATTPELAGTGLPMLLAERFAVESKVRTNVIVTEERFILRDETVAEVVLTTAPSLRDALQRAGRVRIAQTVAYNDYLLVGPRRDRAKAGEAKTAPEALRRIARRERAFCSPVDVPELRAREAMLWGDTKHRTRECRGSALDVLKEASRRGAYTLTDRATFELARKNLELRPLLEGTPLLHNDVLVVLVRRHRNAEWFVQWLMSYRGRDVIGRFRYDGERRFYLREP